MTASAPADHAASAPALLDRVALPLVLALKQFERQGFGAFAERFAARDLLVGLPVRTTLAEVPEGVARLRVPLAALHLGAGVDALVAALARSRDAIQRVRGAA